MPIAPFPHQYVVTLADGDLAAPPRANVATGAPPQFGGTDKVWSPEELLIGAALSCLQTTFVAFALRAPVRVQRWSGTATGTLVKATGGPVFSSVELAVELAVEPGDEALAERVVHDAERACIISRALSVPVHVTVTFAISSTRATG